jgi:hypothetical protein
MEILPNTLDNPHPSSTTSTLQVLKDTENNSSSTVLDTKRTTTNSTDEDNNDDDEKEEKKDRTKVQDENTHVPTKHHLFYALMIHLTMNPHGMGLSLQYLLLPTSLQTQTVRQQQHCPTNVGT